MASNRIAPFRDPQTGPEAREFIAKMERETKSKAARKRMAQLALDRGNLSSAARDAWRDYLESFD